MNLRKQDNDVEVIRQLARSEADKAVKKQAAPISGRKGLTFLQSYTGRGDGGPRFGETYDGFQEFVRARAYNVSGATYGEMTDVVREKIIGKDGIFMYDNFSATQIEVRYAPINNPMHVLMVM